MKEVENKMLDGIREEVIRNTWHHAMKSVVSRSAQTENCIAGVAEYDRFFATFCRTSAILFVLSGDPYLENCFGRTGKDEIGQAASARPMPVL